MIHYECDKCGIALDADDPRRFIVRFEIYTAVGHIDLDKEAAADPRRGLERVLSELAQADPDVGIEPLPHYRAGEENEGEVPAQHHRVTMGEVGKAEDAVDQGEAYGAQGEDAADDYADDEQLGLGQGGPDEERGDQGPDAGPHGLIAEATEAVEGCGYRVREPAGEDRHGCQAPR